VISAKKNQDKIVHFKENNFKNESFSLREYVLTLRRSFTIVRGIKNPEENNSQVVPTDNDNGIEGDDIYLTSTFTNGGANGTSGIIGKKDDIIVDAPRSITRSILDIPIVNGKDSGSSSSLYPPKTCPVCCEDYMKGDDIAWSKNEECCHAFHIDCIMEWLMDHDDCPMCRSNYLEYTHV
jgi:hypothetical protein